MAQKVTLRKKDISNGRQSLYLDFYPSILNPITGKMTRRYFLELYLTKKPRTEIERKSNKETLAIAKNVEAQTRLDINRQDYSFLNSKVDFLEFFRKLIDTKKGGNKRGWETAYSYLVMFVGDNLPISRLNETLCDEFREFLLNAPRQRGTQSETISDNSARTYFNKFKSALKQAFKQKMIDKDLSLRIEGISQPETRREYFTLEELNALVKTPCGQDVIKKAGLFSALTGLRISDIEKLKWSEVKQDNINGYHIDFTQQKTKGVELLPISEQAFNLLGERGDEEEQVFLGLKYSAGFNVHLQRWFLNAGITKDVTFHCFRHTFATLQLYNGTDIMTVSKMLGHRDLKTTQIYAKVVDRAKREATERIKLDL